MGLVPYIAALALGSLAHILVPPPGSGDSPKPHAPSQARQTQARTRREIDSAHGPEFLYQEPQLSKYRAQLDWMEQRALSPAESYDFIRDIARHL